MAIEVTFKESDVKATWDPKDDNLLDFAENQGLDPDYGCRAGSCWSCQCKLVEGEVEYVTEIFDEPEEGMVLICAARPKTNVTFEL
ncbi:MAG: 2Fe-2S iron-sulfur cluster-binding protein [Acidobacteriota bacterium]